MNSTWNRVDGADLGLTSGSNEGKAREETARNRTLSSPFCPFTDAVRVGGREHHIGDPLVQ